MSLQNPIIAAQERAEKARGSGGSLFAAVIFAGLTAVAGGSAGWGFGIIMNQFRVMSLNSVFEWDTADAADWPLPFFVGLFGGIILGGLYARAARRFRGAPALIGPFFFTAMGVAVGFWMYSQNWTKPTETGYAVDTTFGGSEPWGIMAWVMYYANLWIPAAIVLVAVIALVSRLVFVGKVSKKRERAEKLLASGTQVPGTVSTVTETGLEINNQPVISFVVSFVDPAGQTRWVTKKGQFPRATLPRMGDSVTVFFDPATIDDEKTIAVGFATSATPPGA
ncbi:hypothetical protein G7068_08810 [Leucobacter viscericola]|uniref:DUF3592 domain-containing protein n=1 Tax=Leucobacter viscericola TaxID=2714935 RepID=A0A6G7XFW4_9MICO|nr:hypothetical protein [Leucobacter viscericola]QIK63287.1 hypothetical protein G7068_08810 [Leucobacter viscericola]